MLNNASIISFIPSKNLKVARAFYESLLGLRFVSADSFALVFDANGTNLRVVQVAKFEPYPFTVVGWRVPRLKTSVALLQGLGVSFERFDGMTQDPLGIWTSPAGTKVAWFKDPDGNMLSLSQHPK